MDSPQRIDANLVIDELKVQRNAFADDLAVAGAVIRTLKKEIEDLRQAVLEANKKGGS